MKAHIYHYAATLCRWLIAPLATSERGWWLQLRWLPAVFALVAAACGFSLWAHLGLFGIVVVASFVALWFLARHDAHLTARAEQVSSDTWEVRLNDVPVGVVTDAQYAMAQQFAFRDSYLLWAQLGSVLRYLMVFLRQFMFVVPFVVFWGGVAVAVSDPAGFARALHGLSQIDGQTVHTMVIGGATSMLLVLTLSMAGLALGWSRGPTNVYHARVNLILRQLCKVAATGDLKLTRGPGHPGTKAATPS